MFPMKGRPNVRLWMYEYRITHDIGHVHLVTHGEQISSDSLGMYGGQFYNSYSRFTG